MILKLELESLLNLHERADSLGITLENFIAALFVYNFRNLTVFDEDYGVREPLFDVVDGMQPQDVRNAGKLPKSFDTVEIPVLPESITREFAQVAGAYGVTTETLMSDFVNSLYQFEGSDGYERFARVKNAFAFFSTVKPDADLPHAPRTAEQSRPSEFSKDNKLSFTLEDGVIKRFEALGKKFKKETPDLLAATFWYYFDTVYDFDAEEDARLYQKYSKFLKALWHEQAVQRSGPDRTGVLPRNSSIIEVADIPEPVLRELAVLANGYGITTEALMSDFVNALYGFQGSPEFERFTRLARGGFEQVLSLNFEPH